MSKKNLAILMVSGFTLIPFAGTSNGLSQGTKPFSLGIGASKFETPSEEKGLIVRVNFETSGKPNPDSVFVVTATLKDEKGKTIGTGQVSRIPGSKLPAKGSFVSKAITYGEKSEPKTCDILVTEGEKPGKAIARRVNIPIMADGVIVDLVDVSAVKVRRGPTGNEAVVAINWKINGSVEPDKYYIFVGEFKGPKTKPRFVPITGNTIGKKFAGETSYKDRFVMLAPGESQYSIWCVETTGNPAEGVRVSNRSQGKFP